MSYPTKKDLVIGLLVEIRVDKTADTYVKGYIQKILSQDKTDKGVKVELTSGVIGRVERIVPAHELKKENFKFYNELLYKSSLFSIWDNDTKLFHCYEPNNQNKYCFISESKENVQSLIEKLQLDNKRFTVRALPRNSSLSSIFQKQMPLHILINGNRKIAFSKLCDIENKLRKEDSMKDGRR